MSRTLILILLLAVHERTFAETAKTTSHAPTTEVAMSSSSSQQTASPIQAMNSSATSVPEKGEMGSNETRSSSTKTNNTTTPTAAMRASGIQEKDSPEKPQKNPPLAPATNQSAMPPINTTASEASKDVRQSNDGTESITRAKLSSSKSMQEKTNAVVNMTNQEQENNQQEQTPETSSLLDVVGPSTPQSNSSNDVEKFSALSATGTCIQYREEIHVKWVHYRKNRHARLVRTKAKPTADAKSSVKPRPITPRPTRSIPPGNSKLLKQPVQSVVSSILTSSAPPKQNAQPSSSPAQVVTTAAPTTTIQTNSPRPNQNMTTIAPTTAVPAPTLQVVTFQPFQPQLGAGPGTRTEAQMQFQTNPAFISAKISIPSTIIFAFVLNLIV